MEFLDPKLDEYIVSNTSPEPEVLANLNRETHVKILKPRMLAGDFQGRVLSMFSHMIRPKRILEIGTYTGYSAICFAEGLAEGGEIHTIDINEELKPIQDKYFAASGYEDVIVRHVGNALDIIPTLEGTFDIVFIDADKENYVNYYNLVKGKMAKGGYIMADNVLWSGKVIDPKERDDEETKVLMEYNRIVTEDPEVENVLFPIRDGIQISRLV